MTIQEYQESTKQFALYPKESNLDLYYLALGLVGEAGEIANKTKKIIRDHDNIITDEYKETVKAEMGDVMWYMSQLSNCLGFSLENIMKENIEKLQSRKQRGVIKGSSDNR